jgi:hypothetical protein
MSAHFPAEAHTAAGDDGFLLQPVRLGHDEERGAILERRARIQSVVLDPDVVETEFASERNSFEERRVADRNRRKKFLLDRRE